MPRRIIVTAAILLACALGALVVLRRTPTTAADPASRETAPPRATQDTQPPADPGFLGVVVARTSVDLSAKFDSRLETVDVRVGEHVRRNARVALLDVRFLQQDLLMAEAALRTAEAERAQAVLDVTDAAARADRLTRLGDLVSREDAITGRYRADLAETRRARAEAQVAERQARIDQLRETISDAEIRAPFDGVIAARFLDAGATVVRGTPIVRVISPGALSVRFAVPEAQAHEITTGQHVTARLNTPSLAMPGTVNTIAPEIDNALQMVVVEAAIVGNPEMLRTIPAGATARVVLDMPIRQADPNSVIAK